VGVGVGGFVNKLGCASAPFLGSVVVFSHEPEQEVEEVVCRLW
jgi:hypothetical protein